MPYDRSRRYAINEEVCREVDVNVENRNLTILGKKENVAKGNNALRISGYSLCYIAMSK